MGQKCGPPPSRFATFGREIHERMVGESFALAGFSKELVQEVTVSGGKCVFGTPHFLKHEVARRLHGRMSVVLLMVFVHQFLRVQITGMMKPAASANFRSLA